MPFLAAIPALLGAAGVAVPAAVTTGLAAASGALGLASGIARHDPLGAVMGAASGVTGGLGGLPAQIGSGITSGIGAAQSARQGDLLGFLQNLGGAASSGVGAAKMATPNATRSFLGAEYPDASQNLTGNFGPGTEQAKGLQLPQPVDTSNIVHAAAQPEGPADIGADSALHAGIAAEIAKHDANHPATKLLSTIGNGIAGAATAAQGVMSLIQAFKGQKGGGAHGLGLSGMDSASLGPAGSGHTADLSTVPKIGPEQAGQVAQLQMPEISTNPPLLPLLQAFRT